MSDLISRQAAIDAISCVITVTGRQNAELVAATIGTFADRIKALPSAQPTLYGYNIEHLKLIANVLQKENLPPERITEALTDIGRVVAIVQDEFVETLRKTMQNIEWRTDDEG